MTLPSSARARRAWRAYVRAQKRAWKKDRAHVRARAEARDERRIARLERVG